MNLYNYHTNPKSLRKYDEIGKHLELWGIDRLFSLNDEDNFLANHPIPVKDPYSGLMIQWSREYEIPDNRDNNGYYSDDKYYEAEALGTEEQVKKFINKYYDGKGNYIAITHMR